MKDNARSSDTLSKAYYMGQSLESHYRQSDRRDITHLENLFGGMFGPEGRIRAKEAMLLDEGFSRDEVARIKKVSPELKINVLQPMRGQTLAEVASCALQMFQMNHAPVVFKFNSTFIVVQETDTLQSIAMRFGQYEQPRNPAPLSRHQQPHA
jgi:hypothetical protein